MTNSDELIIWDAELYGIPESYDQAMDMALCLSQQTKTQISGKLLDFAKHIEPKLKEVLDGEALLPFLEMSQAVKDTKSAAFILAMPEYNWQLALSLLVTAANEYGLVLFYQEACMAFVAPNKVLPTQAEDRWKATEEFLSNSTFPTTIKKFKQWFSPRLDQLFSKYGFHIGDIDDVDTSNSEWTVLYTKRVIIGTQYIKIYCGKDKVRNGFYVSIWVSMEVDFLNHIYNKFDFEKTRYPDGTLENHIFYGELIVSILNIDDDNTVIYDQISALRLINIVNSKLMPILQIASTLKGLDEALNSEKHPEFRFYAQNSPLKPYCLIVARLVNNPNFNQLALELPKNKRNTEAMKLCWPKFVEYLKENINPDSFFKEFANLKLKEKEKEDLRLKSIQEYFNTTTPEELMSLASQWQDPNTGLIWQQCCIGQHWQNGKAIGIAKNVEWKDAKKLAKQNQNFEWRIPTQDELQMMLSCQKTDNDTTIGILGARDERLLNGNFWALPTLPYKNYEACVQRFQNGIKTSGTYEGHGIKGCVLLVRNPVGEQT